MVSVVNFSKLISLNVKRTFNLYNSKPVISYVAKNFISNQSNLCWKCGASNNNELFCKSCNSIQGPRETKNFFKIFEISETFQINQNSLRNKYRKLQSILHPDKFSNKSQEEIKISEEYSSLLNKAYNSLANPLKRAEHLLHLKGEDINENDSIEDKSFLMEVMELNEEIDEADPSNLKSLLEANKEKIEKLSDQIDNCFNTNDIKTAKELIKKLKYFNNLNVRINAKLRDAGIVD